MGQRLNKSSVLKRIRGGLEKSNFKYQVLSWIYWTRNQVI